MIHDSIQSPTTRFLCDTHPVFAKAFEWIRNMPENPKSGITELIGQQMYVNVHAYDTLPVNACAWESHTRTIDIQYCIAGGEIIDWLPEGALSTLKSYTEATDTQFWAGDDTEFRACPREPVSLRMTADSYAIFLPEELHRPKQTDGTNDSVFKLVVKIQAPLLGL